MRWRGVWIHTSLGTLDKLCCLEVSVDELWKQREKRLFRPAFRCALLFIYTSSYTADWSDCINKYFILAISDLFNWKKVESFSSWVIVMLCCLKFDRWEQVAQVVIRISFYRRNFTKKNNDKNHKFFYEKILSDLDLMIILLIYSVFQDSSGIFGCARER